MLIIMIRASQNDDNDDDYEAVEKIGVKQFVMKGNECYEIHQKDQLLKAKDTSSPENDIKSQKQGMCYKSSTFIPICFIIVCAAFIMALITAFVLIANLQNSISTRINRQEDQVYNLTNILGGVYQIQTGVEMRISELESNLNAHLYTMNMTNLLMDNASSNITTACDVIQQSVVELTHMIVHDIQNLYEFKSCAAINSLSLPFSSGEYMIKTSNGPILMYCTIFSCNGITGGWRRVAYLNTNDSSADQCPGDLEKIGTSGQSNNPLSCRRSNVFEPGCSSVVYPNHGNSYSRVCGMINAYQVGSPDGFRDRLSDSIEGTYVDGVSLTYGMNPRNHIWTFVAQVTDTCTDCGTSQPNFIGSHFSCESNMRCNNNQVCLTDVLWNGDQCVGEAWFYRSLDQPTTDDIEMRVCRSQTQVDEDFRISLVELYVR